MTRIERDQITEAARSPFILISSTRSGTSMLRNLIAKLPGFGTWPADEINYIWRHGNAMQATDEFDPALATPKVAKYIRNTFYKLAQKKKLKRIIEKTPHNSLRIEFVNRIFPEAKFIFSVRDGRDSSASIKKRYRDPLSWSHTLKQASCIPLIDLPYYGVRYLYSRSYRLFTKEKRDAFLGPIYNGMRDDFKKYSLEEVCAIQWKHCVEKAENAFHNIDPKRVHRLRYEDIVSNPIEELSRLGEFLGVDISEELAKQVTSGLHPQSIGKGRKGRDAEMSKKIDNLIGDTLKRHGYV